MSTIERMNRTRAVRPPVRVIRTVARDDHPTRAYIDLAVVAENVRVLRAHAGVPVIAVAKADAYGHGLHVAAHGLVAGGAAMIAVANLKEAALLRTAGISAPILLLGYLPPSQACDALRWDVTCTLFNDEVVAALLAAAHETGRVARVHVEVDTGMGRLGFAPAAVGPLLRRLANESMMDVVGLYTHFASADEPDEHFSLLQLERFTTLLGAVTAAGLRPPLVHAANSAAMLRFPAARFDAVRPGIACYGLAPAPHVTLPARVRPALSLESVVAQLKEVAVGTPLSYGGTFVAQRPTRVATVPIGYADGIQRSPAWREVLVGGRRVPVVGRVCMDYILLDVTDVPDVAEGDQVVLIGAQGDARIDAGEVADWLGTIAHEVLTTIGPRVRRTAVC